MVESKSGRGSGESAERERKASAGERQRSIILKLAEPNPRNRAKKHYQTDDEVMEVVYDGILRNLTPRRAGNLRPNYRRFVADTRSKFIKSIISLDQGADPDMDSGLEQVKKIRQSILDMYPNRALSTQDIIDLLGRPALIRKSSPYSSTSPPQQISIQSGPPELPDSSNVVWDKETFMDNWREAEREREARNRSESALLGSRSTPSFYVEKTGRKREI